jgi:hypothetical protein
MQGDPSENRSMNRKRLVIVVLALILGGVGGYVCVSGLCPTERDSGTRLANVRWVATQENEPSSVRPVLESAHTAPGCHVRFD